MQVTGKVVVVTGGANGIGKALCEAFHKAGAAKVVVADMEAAGARAVAASIDGAAFKCDVGKEKDIRHVIEETERQFGPIALFCSNAGIGGGFDPLSVNAGGNSDEPWQRSWAVHVMAHVYAARHLIPRMKARGGGYFLNTISAAGLLSQVGSPAYSTTKHAAVDPEGPAIRRRRPVAGAGGAGRAEGTGRGNLCDPAAPAGAGLHAQED